jgi:hypothetical protein
VAGGTKSKCEKCGQIVVGGRRRLNRHYDIFRQIFHNEEDALAATIQLFRGDPISWDEDYE